MVDHLCFAPPSCFESVMQREEQQHVEPPPDRHRSRRRSRTSRPDVVRANAAPAGCMARITADHDHDEKEGEQQVELPLPPPEQHQQPCYPRNRRMQEEERPESWPIMTMMKIMKKRSSSRSSCRHRSHINVSDVICVNAGWRRKKGQSRGRS